MRKDVLLGAIGTAMGLVTLPFPFGRDQGLYHYVAREWVLHGAIPYRDVFDHKPPGLYIVYALAIRIFGVNLWGIRVLDMIGVLLVGLLAAALTTKNERPKPGVRGASILAANILFFGYLNFWDTAQSELWYSLLGVASVWAARNIRRDAVAQLAAGAFAASALVFKPPAIFFVLVALWFLFLRSREKGTFELVRAAARFAAGAGLILGAVVAYFAAHHAVGAMYAIVVQANSYYAAHENGWMAWHDPFSRVRGFFDLREPISTAALLLSAVALLTAKRDGNRERLARYVLALALCVAGWAAVLMQMKFYELHWTVTIAPSVCVCANLAADAGPALAAILPEGRLRRLDGVSVFAAGILVLYSLSGDRAFPRFMGNAASASEYVAHRISREEYTADFQFPDVTFWATDSERAGNYLREHTTEDDYIAVRGFEPQIYAIAQRRYPGRFFWTLFFVSPSRGTEENRAKWQEEDRLALEKNPPKFVVTLTGIHEGPNSAEWFLPKGYVQREVFGQHTVLERVGAP